MLSLQTTSDRESRRFQRQSHYGQMSGTDVGLPCDLEMLKERGDLPITFLVASLDRYEDRASPCSLKAAPAAVSAAGAARV